MTLGRIKGNAAEREIAMALHDYWLPIEDAKFVRTPLSGGWGGKEVRAEFRASGDLMTTAKAWPFVVEVKRREGWAWKPFLAGKRSPIWGWWRQACTAADELTAFSPAVPLLIFRKNREEWQVMLPFEVYQRAKVSADVLVRSRARAWYKDQLQGRDGAVFPICSTFEDFLSHPPSEWVRVCTEVGFRAG